MKARHEYRHPSPPQTAQQQVPDPRPKTSSTFYNTDIIRKRVPEATCLNSERPTTGATSDYPSLGCRVAQLKLTRNLSEGSTRCPGSLVGFIQPFISRMESRLNKPRSKGLDKKLSTKRDWSVVLCTQLHYTTEKHGRMTRLAFPEAVVKDN
ncbi:hypothetical protein J6590_080246 [Homalodisca vitripennis]|nr:hypothetical protein J6590_080246 [Homalodisca vitripennis]